MSKTTTTTTTKKKFTMNGIVNFLAYVAIIFIAVALIAGKLIGEGSNIALALTTIAQAISYALVGYFSFLFVRGKRNWVHILVWAVAVTLIVVSLVLAGF